MRILIVDDEAPARARLVSLIEALGEHEVVGQAANGAEALDACQRLRPELVLMDIRMPGLDGLEAAAQLSLMPEPPAVVFCTAYGDYALEAFEAEAVDYLLKPVRRERLAEALKKARRLNRAQLAALRRQPGSSDGAEAAESGRRHLLCRRRGNLELIPIEEVRFLQADHKYVTVNHSGGEDLIEDSLKRLEEAFPDRFLRVHRNALVARNCLEGLERGRDGQYFVRLRGVATPLEVSRRHVADVKALIRSLGLA